MRLPRATDNVEHIGARNTGYVCYILRRQVNSSRNLFGTFLGREPLAVSPCLQTDICQDEGCLVGKLPARRMHCDGYAQRGIFTLFPLEHLSLCPRKLSKSVCFWALVHQVKAVAPVISACYSDVMHDLAATYPSSQMRVNMRVSHAMCGTFASYCHEPTTRCWSVRLTSRVASSLETVTCGERRRLQDSALVDGRRV